MLQQVNLYKQLPSKQLVLPGRQIISLNVLFITVLLILSIIRVIDYYVAFGKLKKLEAMQVKLNRGLISAQQTVLTEEQKKDLKKKLILLQQESDYKKKMYKTFLDLNYKHSIGWSKYLTDMAQTNMPDIWITNFKFSNGSEVMHFEGVSLRHSSVLKYLQDLGKTTTFQRKNFSDLQIFWDDKAKQIKFSIDS